MKKSMKGQAVILLIFVIGMIGLLIGVTLSKTGFIESMMGRGTVGSTYAFYVANAGVEDAFYKILDKDKLNQDYENTSGYSLQVGEGSAKVKVTNIMDGDSLSKVIEATGKYRNYVRKIRVVAYNTKITPEFTRIIQVGQGGIEIENNVKISAKDNGVEYAGGNIHSNSFIRGSKNNNDGNECKQSSSFINGNASAVSDIDRLGGGGGPCISGDAFAGNLKYCKVFGNAFSSAGYNSDCPIDSDKQCDPVADPVNCKVPDIVELPNIQSDKIKQYLENYAESYVGNCEIGGENDCSTIKNGERYLGNIIIDGDLDVNANIYLSGPVWVKGSSRIRSNLSIFLDPDVSDITSLIILVSGQIITDSNVTFNSSDSSYLLLASEYEDYTDDDTSMCDEGDGNAITVNSNVNSVLFYAINGCALVYTTGSGEFYGAIIAEAVKLNSNVELYYDPDLQNATFYLNQENPWQISSFTEL